MAQGEKSRKVNKIGYHMLTVVVSCSYNTEADY
jgi:hypothetical protein